MTRADWLLVGYTAVWVVFGLVQWGAHRRARRLDVRELRDSNPGAARAVGAAGVVMVVADVAFMSLLISVAVGLRGASSARLVHVVFACLGLCQLFAALVGWRFGVEVVSVPKAKIVQIPSGSRLPLLQVLLSAGLAILPVVLLALGV